MNRTSRNFHANRDSERGFTIIEVMVAALILAMGILVTFSLFDAANALTVDNRAREGATNLTRELIDDARSLDYSTLDSAQITPTLQGLPGLGDANLATPGWQIIRGGVTYTVTADACIFDSAKDGARTVAANNSSFCPNSVTPGGTPVDGNPDDYRRVEISVVWSRPGHPSVCGGQGQSTTNTRNAVCVIQSTLIPNPAGGLGPAIDPSSFSQTPPNVVETVNASGITVTFKTRTAADTVNWAADDAASSGTATATDTTFKNWTLNWGGPSPSPPLPTLDGNYTLSLQGFLLNVPGDVTPYVVSLNLNSPGAPGLPTAPTNPAGVDSRQINASPPQSSNFIVDINWQANPERDIVGYAVFRVPVGQPSPSMVAGNVDPVVCTTHSASITNCIDPSPPANGIATYYVVAFDQPWKTKPNIVLNNCVGFSAVDGIAAGTAVQLFDPQFNGGALARGGCPSNLIPVNITAGLANTPPGDPTSGSGTINSNGLPHLSWSASSADPDGEPILYYRIYRDPSSTNPIPYAERYDRTTGNVTSYDDPNPGASTTHRYFVTAVDSSYQESQPLEIDTP